MAHGRTAVFVFAAGVVMACLTLLSSVPAVRADGDESGLSPEFQDLYEWLEFNGMSGSGNAGLDPNPINGRGVVALADIAKGEKIVSIPKKVRLSAKVALNGKIGKPLKELMEAGVGSQELLTITLLFEKHRADEESYWAPFIDSLPEDFETVPLFFDPETLAAVEGSARSVVDAQIDAVERIHGVLEQLNKYYPQLFPVDVFTIEEVKWAFFIVNSRAWRDNDGATYFFQPLGDMVEHSAEGNVETSISKAGRTSLIARTDIKAGTPLTFTQRVDQAGPFFCQMGHLPDLSTNFVPLNFAPDHDPDDLFSSTVEAMLAAADCGTINRDKVVRLGEPFPDTVLYCMRISFMTPGEYARVVTYEQLTEEAWDPAMSFSLENDLVVFQTLLGFFEHGLAPFSTSIAADEAMLADPAGLSASIRNAVTLRLNEKRILTHGVKEIERMWSSLLRQ